MNKVLVEVAERVKVGEGVGEIARGMGVTEEWVKWVIGADAFQRVMEGKGDGKGKERGEGNG